MNTASSPAPPVAHLVAPDAPVEQLEALGQLLRGGGPRRAAIVSIGGAGARLRACADVQPLHIALPFEPWRRSSTLAAIRRLGFVADRTILHAWSPVGSAVAAAAADCVRAIIVDAPRGAAPGEWIHWPTSGRLMHAARCVVRCARDGAAFQSHGVPSTLIAAIEHTPDCNADPSVRESVRRSLALERGDAAMLIVPPITPASGAFYALWAALLVQKIHPRLRVIVLDGGAEAARLRRLTRSTRHEFLCRFAGPRAPLADLLSAADLAIAIPSGSCAAVGVLAAARSGVPLVLSRTPDFEMLIAAEHAAWCEAGSLQRAARAVMHVVDDLGSARTRAAQGRAAAIARFNPDAMAAAYCSLYQQM